jgi:hypothetical protein
VVNRGEPKTEDNDYDAKSSIRNAVGFAAVTLLVLIMVSFAVVPSFSPAHQGFLTGVIGSFAGSILAFQLAVVLWRIERKVLIAERAQDRLEGRRGERERNDKNLLRECLAAVNQLRALDFSVLEENRSSTQREKYFLGLRISQAASLIADNALREEARFIDSLTNEDTALDYMVTARYMRLRTAVDWFGRLVSLDPDANPHEARPDDYSELLESVRAYDEYKTEEQESYAESYAEWKREEREFLAKERQTPSASE